jgi:hypothetical protein
VLSIADSAAGGFADHTPLWRRFATGFAFLPGRLDPLGTVVHCDEPDRSWPAAGTVDKARTPSEIPQLLKIHMTTPPLWR